MALTWEAIKAKKNLVLEELFTISTTADVIHDKEVDFIVRVAASLAKKPPTAPFGVSTVSFDPFENPSSQKLFGGPVTATHSMIFNKFNLVDNHMLIVTNEFESQYDKLTVADMEATWKSIKELNGLGFFNGGRLAGASQPHKHLQLVPTPLVPDSPYALPIESVLLGSSLPSSVKDSIPFTHPGLPFFNLFALLPENLESDAPQLLHQLYNDMLALAEPAYQKNCIQQPWCFNLLIMKSWMLLVPRSKECVEGTTISVNSMGFAGTLFVKSQEHLEIVKQLGPMGVLQALSLPISSPLAL